MFHGCDSKCLRYDGGKSIVSLLAYVDCPYLFSVAEGKMGIVMLRIRYNRIKFSPTKLTFHDPAMSARSRQCHGR